MSIQLAKPINDAIKKGELQQLIQLLDDHPEAIHMETPWGSWLHVAAEEGQLPIVKELLKRGLDVNARGGILRGNAMQHAVHGGHFEVTKYLLEEGADMDVSTSHFNPLFAAILDDNVTIAQLLIDRGIDAYVKYNNNAMKNMDATAFAKEQGAEKCLKLLEAITKKENREE